MHHFPKGALKTYVCAWFACSVWFFPTATAAQIVTRKPVATVRTVSVRNGVNNAARDASGDLELQITTSQPLTPRTQIVVSPYRLVLDFPDASPGSELHDLAVNRGDVKGIRVGLFASNPPVTRVVVDLKGPIGYQVSPSGQTVIVKLNSAASAAAMPGNAPVAAVAIPKPAPRVEVHFKQGMMSIHADKASLAEVLMEVRRQTGADIQIPPGADQEQVFTDLGPASARDVMAALLNGSRFNFVLAGSDSDPNALRSVILTSRSGGGASMPAQSSPQVESAPPQQFSAVQPEARPDMRRPPEGVEPQMPVEQEDPGDTPPPAPPSE